MYCIHVLSTTQSFTARKQKSTRQDDHKSDTLATDQKASLYGSGGSCVCLSTDRGT